MDCPHGYPTRMACTECMMDGAVAPPTPAPEQVLRAEKIIVARFDSRCARSWVHDISAGESIGYVTDVGWCCSRCAR
jgi:hypothetical protein